MQKLLVSVLLISSLCSFTKKKKKPEPAFAKQSFTVIAGTGWPNLFRDYRGKSVGPINVGVDYQASKRWCFGLQYSFSYSKSDVQKYLVYKHNGLVYTPTDSFLFQQKQTNHTFMATADFCYLNRGRVCLNSGIGLGYTIEPTTSFSFPDGIDHSSQIRRDRGIWAFRLRLINAKVKITENFGVYGGLNIGVDGFVLVGCHYTFKGRE